MGPRVERQAPGAGPEWVPNRRRPRRSPIVRSMRRPGMAKAKKEAAADRRARCAAQAAKDPEGEEGP